MCRLSRWYEIWGKRQRRLYHMEDNHTGADSMNGWANWETWCASLWISNDEMLYRTARIYGHSGYDHLIPYLQAFGETNGDGLRWDDPAIDRAEMDEMLQDL